MRIQMLPLLLGTIPNPHDGESPCSLGTALTAGSRPRLLVGRRDRQSGLGPLLVFPMAAVIAVMSHSVAPRVDFRAQHQKGQLLKERGEQHKRAIRFSYRRNLGYPVRPEILESFSNRRSPRRRSVDSKAGKDDWGVIHTGPGGVRADLLASPPRQPVDDRESPQQHGARNGNGFPACGSSLKLAMNTTEFGQRGPIIGKRI